MLRLGRKRRDVAAQTLREAASVVAGAVVVGQFFGRGASSPWALVAEAVLWLALAAAAIACTKEDNNG